MIETERKFLIRYPDEEFLKKTRGCTIKKIAQTYLVADKGKTRRVRIVECNGKTTYVFTEKTRISPLSCIENEREISKAEYDSLLKENDISKETVFKTRYAIPYAEHILEIDIYSFWDDFATLEIELSNENEQHEIPDYINVVKEVTADSRFKNANLAKNHNFNPEN